MHCSLVPRMARIRLNPPIAEQPDPGSRLLQRHGGVVEIIAARPLEQVSPGGGLVAQLPRRAGEQRAAQHRITPDDARIGGEIAVRHQRADRQPAIGALLDRREIEPADIDQLLRRLDLQLHQVEQVGPARDEASARRDGGLGTIRPWHIRTFSMGHSAQRAQACNFESRPRCWDRPSSGRDCRSSAPISPCPSARPSRASR